MSTWRFERLFAPRAVAVVGAGDRPDSVGRALLTALKAGGFAGAVWPVNPRHARIDGTRCHPSLKDLPGTPDLVLIATPPETVPGLVAQAADAGAAGAILIASEPGEGAAARIDGMRLIGPGSMGLSVPAQGLNASLLARPPRRGDVALVSQSGTLASAIAEWAGRRGVGFSGVVTLGREADVDVADCLDHFAADPHTRAILLCVQTIGDARKFLSAARAAARVKPVVVLRAGRRAPARGGDGAAPQTHTGALARPDAVYAAAFRRAGLLAVEDLDAMFSALEALTRQRPFPGKRLMILANGAGIGALAADRLTALGGTLAPAEPNPLDLGVEAIPADYGAALTPLLTESSNDAVLVLHVPTARAGAAEVAREMVGTLVKSRGNGGAKKPVFSSLVGEDAEAAAILAQAGIPLFRTDAEAIDGFLHLVRYREAQDDLMRTPDSLPRDVRPNVGAARRIVREALEAGQTWLDPARVEALLSAYAIPMEPCALAPDGDGAAEAAWPLIAAGRPVALKLVSPDIVHKSDVGGVRLGLTSEADVREAAARMVARVRRLRPEARIVGFAVQAMIPRGARRELIAGLAEDPVFGPVVVFGRGGNAVEVVDDRAIALPPLDLRLATEQIGRTRVARRLGAYRDVPAADIGAIALVLVKLAQLAADLPELRELDINPLLADADGVLGLDARVRLAPYEPPQRAPSSLRGGVRGGGCADGTAGAPSGTTPTSGSSPQGGGERAVPSTGSAGHGAPPARSGDTVRRRTRHDRLAIRPYPAEWERAMSLRGRPIRVRPVRPDDEAMFAAFFARIDPEDVRLRFFAPVKRFSHAFLARLTQLDYARAIAFVALDEGADDLGQRMLGAVRLHADANHETGEFAILVRTDLKGYGLGYALMRLMIDWAKAEGIQRIEGTVLAENRAMLAVCRRLGFVMRADPEETAVVTVGLKSVA